MTYEYLSLEPIGLLFVIFFAVVMFIQVIGMLAHRIMTLGHIVSTTKLNFFTGMRKKLARSRGKDKVDVNKEIQKSGVSLIKDMIKNAQVSSVNICFKLSNYLII